MNKAQQGFTLLELMIVVAIIGILISLAVPTYQHYTTKARFAEVVNATAPYKTAVEICLQKTGKKDDCDQAAHGIPADGGPNGGYVASVSVKDGEITATAVGTTTAAIDGLKGEKFTLTPTYNAATGTVWKTNVSDASLLP